MNPGKLIIGSIFIAIGISAFTGIDIFRYLIPAFFIFVGIKILMGKDMPRKGHIGTSELHQDDINEVAIFSASGKRVISEKFSGGKASSIFSGMELDLSRAKMNGKTAEMELVSIFGGMKVTVPKDWRVVIDGAGVVGGFSNNTSGGTENSPKLTLRGAAIFGGVEIVN